MYDFNKSEMKVIKMINAHKQITIKELTQKFYKGRIPMEANNYVAQVVRRINRKCEYNKLGWTIDGQGAGRQGRTIWVASRKKKRKSGWKSK